jgi:flavin reductase (DIM6/NTAB) family NADH-FMN oxidoreductase RutF/DNA-binding IclR family transcriptional regulator
MTVGSFTSVSLDPPLVGFFPTKNSGAFDAMTRAGRFCVNVLGRDQEQVCRTFASRSTEKFDGVDWQLSPLGSPVLEGAIAWVDCRVHSITDAGDHLFVLGHVDDLAVGATSAPLMFFQGGYGRFSSLSLIADDAADLTAQLRLADLARPHLEALADGFGVEAHASALAGERVVQLAWACPGGDAFRTNKVGLRLPLLPPMGSVLVAWDDAATQAEWASRSGRALEGVYLQELAATRRNGWVAIPDHQRLRQIEALVVRMAVEGSLPGLERELAANLEAYAAEYPAASGAAVDSAPPSTFTAPVFDVTGRVVLAVAVQGDPSLESVDKQALLNALLAAAAALTGAIGGRKPELPQ